MKSTLALMTLMCLSIPASASPFAKNNIEKRVVTGEYCQECDAGPWTTATWCPEYSVLLSSFSNPPASISFDAVNFCSNYLQPLSFDVHTTTITTAATDFTWTTVHTTVTSTDSSEPTGYIYCPIKNSDSTCGISSDTIDSTAMQEDWSHSGIVSDENDCHQTCLSVSSCKSFRVSAYTDPAGNSGFSCDIFDIALGKDGANVPGGRPGNEYFDRDCPDHLPTQCGAQKRSTNMEVRGLAPAAPAITPAPVARDAALRARDWTIPDYIAVSWGADIGLFEIQEACSCIITSALPVVSSSVPFYDTVYTTTISVLSTFVDTSSVVVSAHQTTIVTSVS